MLYIENYGRYKILQNSIEDKKDFEVWDMIDTEFLFYATTVEEAKRRIEEHKEQRGY